MVVDGAHGVVRAALGLAVALALHVATVLPEEAEEAGIDAVRQVGTMTIWEVLRSLATSIGTLKAAV